MEKNPLFCDPEFLKKLIPSKTMRDDVAGTGWIPTDFQLAALISHMNIPLEEKESYWATIAGGTEDPVLRGQINEALLRRERGFNLLSQPGEYVFSLRIADEKGKEPRFEEEYGYFLSFEEALETGKQTLKPFQIRKHCLGPAQKRAVGGFNPFMGDDAPGQERVLFACLSWIGFIEYNEKGQAVFLELALDADPEIPPGEALRREFDPDRFERAYVPLPNPFERGEIVAILDKQGKIKGYGVVQTTQEDRKDCHLRERYREYWDEAIIVEHIDEGNGDFTHSHMNPFYLERGTPKDKTTREYLEEGQRLFRGKGSVQGLLRARRAYRAAHCEKEDKEG